MHVLLAWLLAAALTVAIETPILFIAGYRRRTFVVACVLINIGTNLTLNVAMAFTGQWYFVVLFPAEVLVVIVEWAVLRLAANEGRCVPWHSKPAARLLGFVFLANLASFLVGVMLWH